jgi:hypothetical protein
MALVKYGGGIVGASGSIAGTTHARNRFGNYIRARTKPVNPRSTAQSLVRNTLAFLTELWHSTITAPQRTAWGTYAGAIAVKNKLGETIYLTGFNHFVRSNSISKSRLNTYVATGPTTLALPETDPSFVITASVATQLVSIEFDNALPWALEVGAHMFVELGQPQIVTRNFFGGPWKYMNKIAGKVAPAETSPKTMAPPYTLVLGQKIWAYTRIRRADGRLSNPMVSSCIVAA